MANPAHRVSLIFFHFEGIITLCNLHKNKNRYNMRAFILLISMLAFSAGIMASDVANGIDHKWVKVFGLTIERSDSQLFTNYRPSSSTSVEIFASTDIRNRQVYAFKSDVNFDDSFATLSGPNEELNITRAQYLSLLDLATRQSITGEGLVYETNIDCNAPQLIKHLYFNGKVQSILSNCSSVDRFSTIPSGMRLLVARLEALLTYENLERAK